MECRSTGFDGVRTSLDEQNRVREAARLALGRQVSLRRLSGALLEAALRTLEGAGLSAQIPEILRAAADNCERAAAAEGRAN